MTPPVRSVLFVVRSDDSFPSCRFRAYQLREPLERLGMRVGFLRASRSLSPLKQGTFLRALAREAPRYDAVIYQKLLHPAHIRVAAAYNPNVFYDIDDALWITSSELRFALTVLAAPRVIAGNTTLAEHVRRYNRRVSIVPTTVVVPRETPAPRAADGAFVLSWVGSAVNLRYLAPVRAALRKLRAGGTDVQLHIVTEQPKAAAIEPGVTVERWSREAEDRSLRACDVGLMPLVDDAWSRGKCACKALQYLSYARPIITSPVGMNREIFAGKPYALMPESEPAWVNAIVSYAERRRELYALGLAGRDMVLRDFSVDAWAPRLREVLSTGARRSA